MFGKVLKLLILNVTAACWHPFSSKHLCRVIPVCQIVVCCCLVRMHAQLRTDENKNA